MPGWLQAQDGPGAMITDMLRQPSVRKALPFMVIFMLLVSVAVFFTSLKPTPYRPLVMMLSDTDKQAAVEALKAADFKPEIDQGSGQISVPTARETLDVLTVQEKVAEFGGRYLGQCSPKFADGCSGRSDNHHFIHSCSPVTLKKSSNQLWQSRPSYRWASQEGKNRFLNDTLHGRG